MTADDPALSPAEEAAVRARLAEARHTEPGARPVVARLDGVLVDLAAERTADARRARGPPTSYPSPPGAGAPSPPGWSPPRPSWPSAWPSPRSSTPRAGPTASSGSAADAAARSRGRARPGRRGSDGAAAGCARPARPAESRPSGQQRADRLGVRRPPRAPQDEALRPAVRPLARQGAVTAYDASPGCALDVGAGERVDATLGRAPRRGRAASGRGRPPGRRRSSSAARTRSWPAPRCAPEPSRPTVPRRGVRHRGNTVAYDRLGPMYQHPPPDPPGALNHA